MGQLVPRRVGVDGFCVVIINLIQFCAFVGLNYSNEICLTFTSRDMAVQLLPRCENVGDMGVSNTELQLKYGRVRGIYQGCVSQGENKIYELYYR